MSLLSICRVLNIEALTLPVAVQHAKQLLCSSAALNLPLSLLHLWAAIKPLRWAKRGRTHSDTSRSRLLHSPHSVPLAHVVAT